MAFMGVKRLFRVYDLLCEAMPREEVIDILERHAFSERVVVAEEDGEITGVAFFWHVVDPYDVQEEGYPGEDPHGKYLYFPQIYIRKDRRDGSVLKELIAKAFCACPTARRIAFHRPRPRNDRLRVLTRIFNYGNAS